MSFLALRREWLPPHYGRRGPQRPQTFSKRQLRLKGGARQRGKKHLGPNPPTTTSPSLQASPLPFTRSATRYCKWEATVKYSAPRFPNPIVGRRTPPNPTQHSWSIRFSEPSSAPPPRPHPPRRPLFLAELGALQKPHPPPGLSHTINFDSKCLEMARPSLNPITCHAVWAATAKG